MTYNNTVILIGNLGDEAKIHERGGKAFASVSIATQDSYQDDQDNWVQKESLWHDLLIFSPKVVASINSLKKGTRIRVTGSLSYRPFQTQLVDGSTVTKKQASIIVGKIELAPLVKKLV